MADARFVVDAQAIQNYFDSPAGPVYRHMAEKADQVQQRAKVRVGKDTHATEQAIVKRFTTFRGHLAVLVGVFSGQRPDGKDVGRIALMHHEGTQPHVIVPKRRTALRFQPKGSTRYVFARRVNHPGTKPVRFLTEALRDVFGS